MLNFNLAKNGVSYVSEDPLSLGDRVVRAVQSLIQIRVQSEQLRDALSLNRALAGLIKENIKTESSLSGIGVEVLDATVAAITPTPETARALGAEARESILKEADDAIYNRRKSAVEQERTIKEAELQTQLSVQTKEQEIEESRIANERAILRMETETAKEKMQAEIDAEEKRLQLVELSVENTRREADAEAYSIKQRMQAFAALPVENLKAVAQANMDAESLMALAFDNFAENAGKIGELNISPDLFGQLVKKSAPRR